MKVLSSTQNKHPIGKNFLRIISDLILSLSFQLFHKK